MLNGWEPYSANNTLIMPNNIGKTMLHCNLKILHVTAATNKSIMLNTNPHFTELFEFLIFLTNDDHELSISYKLENITDSLNDLGTILSRLNYSANTNFNLC